MRTAIVTGAGPGPGGLGARIAARLAQEGYNVLLADADPGVEQSAARLRDQVDARVGIAHFAGDLSSEDAVQAMVQHALAEFGGVDVLVNNAGGGIIKPFLEHDAQSLQTTLARNLWTTIWCCHKALPVMIKQGHGRIVNIGADSLRTGIPNHAAYNAAKGGVVGLTVGLARDWAHMDITVNTVSPCAINSGRLQARLESEPALAKAFIDVIPKGRPAGVDEVCDLVCFLARRESGFITGQDISVNGGSAMP